MNDFILEPTQFNDHPGCNSAKHLLSLILDQCQYDIISPGSYVVQYQEREVNVKLTKLLIKRTSEKHPEKNRIDVFEKDSSFSGGSAVVFKGCGTLTAQDGYQFKSKPAVYSPKGRIAKCVFFKPSKNTNQETIKRESDITQKDAELHSKKVVFDDRGGFIIMKYIPSIELFDLKEDLRMGEKKRSDRDYLTLACNITRTIINFHKLGYIHRDIKPENIRIDEDSLNAKLIDFFLAMERNAIYDDGAVSGTPHYIAPEIIQGSLPSLNSESFALGMVLAELFGDISSADLPDDWEPDIFLKYHCQRKWELLFRNNEFPIEIKESLTALFDNLCHFYPDKRISPPTALRELERICHSYDLQEKNREHLVRSPGTMNLYKLFSADNDDDNSEYLMDRSPRSNAPV